MKISTVAQICTVVMLGAWLTLMALFLTHVAPPIVDPLIVILTIYMLAGMWFVMGTPFGDNGFLRATSIWPYLLAQQHRQNWLDELQQ